MALTCLHLTSSDKLLPIVARILICFGSRGNSQSVSELTLPLIEYCLGTALNWWVFYRVNSSSNCDKLLVQHSHVKCIIRYIVALYKGRTCLYEYRYSLSQKFLSESVNKGCKDWKIFWNCKISNIIANHFWKFNVEGLRTISIVKIPREPVSNWKLTCTNSLKYRIPG